MKSNSSAVNVSKARSKVEAFLKARKQIIDNSDSAESGDDIINLVITNKEDKIDETYVIIQTPVERVLEAKN
jgi:hypothetical protein